MAFLSSMNVVGSGLTAQQLRLDVVSENITNMNTTRTEGGGPYRRKVVVLESQSNQTAFQAALERAHVSMVPGSAFGAAGEGYVRIACTTSQEQLALAFDHLKQAGF